MSSTNRPLCLSTGSGLTGNATCYPFFRKILAGLLFHIVRVSVGPGRSRRHEGAHEIAYDSAHAAPRTAPRIAPSRRSAGRAILLATPLTLVVIAGLWTPSPIAAAFDQVVMVLGGGRG